MFADQLRRALDRCAARASQAGGARTADADNHDDDGDDDVLDADAAHGDDDRDATTIDARAMQTRAAQLKVCACGSLYTQDKDCTHTHTQRHDVIVHEQITFLRALSSEIETARAASTHDDDEGAPVLHRLALDVIFELVARSSTHRRAEGVYVCVHVSRVWCECHACDRSRQACSHCSAAGSCRARGAMRCTTTRTCGGS
jgi:hypothetical protein